MTLDSTPDKRARIGEECGKWYSSPQWGQLRCSLPRGHRITSTEPHEAVRMENAREAEPCDRCGRLTRWNRSDGARVIYACYNCKLAEGQGE